MDAWVSPYGFKTFIDIGAHHGEFVDHWLASFPGLEVIAFEPLPEFSALLKAKYAQNKKIKIHDLALGDAQNEQIPLHISSYAPSSSLLKMGALHKEAFPHTAESTSTQVKIARLDDVLSQARFESPLLIKIDTQGYEHKVISGGEATLAKAKLLLIEVSFSTLYEEQELFDGIYSRLKKLGFRFIGMRNQILSPLDKRPLQAHAWFENTLN